MHKNRFFASMLVLALSAGLAVLADPANAIMRLLNSRASGSRKEYAAAAEEVAEKAK